MYCTNKTIFKYIFMYEKTDKEIIALLADRLKQYRLQHNVTVRELSDSSGLHVNTIAKLEAGEDSRLSTVIRILRGLKRLEALDAFLPPPTISPLQLAKLKSKRRQRARKIAGG